MGEGRKEEGGRREGVRGEEGRGGWREGGERRMERKEKRVTFVGLCFRV